MNPMDKCGRCTAPHVVVVSFVLRLCGWCYLDEMLKLEPPKQSERKCCNKGLHRLVGENVYARTDRGLRCVPCKREYERTYVRPNMKGERA